MFSPSVGTKLRHDDKKTSSQKEDSTDPTANHGVAFVPPGAWVGKSGPQKLRAVARATYDTGTDVVSPAKKNRASPATFVLLSEEPPRRPRDLRHTSPRRTATGPREAATQAAHRRTRATSTSVAGFRRPLEAWHTRPPCLESRTFPTGPARAAHSQASPRTQSATEGRRASPRARLASHGAREPRVLDRAQRSAPRLLAGPEHPGETASLGDPGRLATGQS